MLCPGPCCHTPGAAAGSHLGDDNLKIPINFAPLWQLRDPEELLISIGLFLHNISFNTVIFRKLYSFFLTLLTFVQYSVTLP